MVWIISRIYEDRCGGGPWNRMRRRDRRKSVFTVWGETNPGRGEEAQEKEEVGREEEGETADERERLRRLLIRTLSRREITSPILTAIRIATAMTQQN